MKFHMKTYLTRADLSFQMSETGVRMLLLRRDNNSGVNCVFNPQKLAVNLELKLQTRKLKPITRRISPSGEPHAFVTSQHLWSKSNQTIALTNPLFICLFRGVNKLFTHTTCKF